jgi:hypothetical protein
MSELNDFIKDQIQRIFNIQKRKDICEKYPAAIFSKENSDLPADIEAEWHRYIEEFEEKFENASEIPVFQFIGSPTIKPINDIPAHEVENEYLRLELLLYENGVYVEFPENIDVRTKYEFITREIMHEEIENIRIEGMLLIFDYEEFHPSEDIN